MIVQCLSLLDSILWHGLVVEQAFSKCFTEEFREGRLGQEIYAPAAEALRASGAKLSTPQPGEAHWRAIVNQQSHLG